MKTGVPQAAVSERTRLKRGAKRAVHDPARIHAIVDEALVCHVAAYDGAYVHLQPQSPWRIGNELFLHGSSRNGLFRVLKEGAEAVVSVMLLDGLVWARSAFHHSVNYRSVILYGRPRLVDDPPEKWAALEAMMAKFAPGRWDQVRQPSPSEMKATEVFALPMTEASCKVRSGPPVDDSGDMNLPVWAGVVPYALVRGTPVPDTVGSGT